MNFSLRGLSPLDKSFLKRCVPMSCCSGELEKIICIMSSEIKFPCDVEKTEIVIIYTDFFIDK